MELQENDRVEIFDAFADDPGVRHLRGHLFRVVKTWEPRKPRTAFDNPPDTEVEDLTDGSHYKMSSGLLARQLPSDLREVREVPTNPVRGSTTSAEWMDRY